MIQEKEIRAAVRKYLKISGWFVFGVWQGMYSHKGISDLIAVKGGVVLFIEIKSERGRQRPEQIQFEHDITAAAGHYVFVRSVEDVDRYIMELSCERSLIFS